MPIVEILHVPGCANFELARRRVHEAADRIGVDIEIRERVVSDETVTAAMGMAGSPTILIDGRDVEQGHGGAPISCRLYHTPSGIEGAPSVDTIASALGDR